MVEASEPVSSFDTSVPNAARMYDYWLGGKDNFAADRVAAERSAAAVPQLPWLARENRAFLGRAVSFCASAGVTQFLDIGTGLPTMNSVHQVARQVAASPRVVYVDNDPVVVSHARALLTTPGTLAVRGDLTRPDEFLGDPDVRAVIDFSEPVAILLVAVLHFIPDDVDPVGAVAKLRDAMAPGSYLVISHVVMTPGQVSSAQPQTETARELGEARRGMPPACARTKEEVAAFFGDLTVVEPGLTDVWDWQPDADTVVVSGDVMTVIGGVARKD
ncbi:MAG TPA: SAM-dependent methyltransferase [Streptosporangiaceae bacterium]|nr:SAM-dependent methyltransferase [Streptosporangiaceae bacterium]